MNQPHHATTIQAEILRLLEAGPRRSSQLGQIPVSKSYLIHQLNALRAAGEIKRVDRGNRLKWALSAWEPPNDAASFNTTTTGPRGRPPRPKAPSESWWVGKSREEFSAEVAAHAPAMTMSGRAHWVDGQGRSRG